MAAKKSTRTGATKRHRGTLNRAIAAGFITAEVAEQLHGREPGIESRARRAAERAGYFMRKSRAAPSINNHGQFRLIDGDNNIVAGEKFDMTALEIVRYLDGD